MTTHWLTHDWPNRKRFAHQLLKKIRLGIVPVDRLSGILYDSPIQEDSQTSELIERVLELHAARDTMRAPLSYSHPQMFESRSTITVSV